MLIDDWHISQFSAPLQYPLFKLYYSFFGTEGIILYFRYVYIVCQLAVSLFVFLRLYKQYGYTALAASVMYCHYLIMNTFAISYYTMSVMATIVICVLLFTGERTKKSELIAAGLFTGAAVLSEPLLALIYFAYAAAVFAIRIAKKKDPPDELLSVRSFLYITGGVFVSATAFFIFLFSRAGIRETFEAIPAFFTDSEYNFPVLSEGIQNLFGYELFVVLKNIGLPFFIVDAILLIAMFADRKRLIHRPFYLIAAGALALATLITIYVRFFAESRMFYLTRHIPLFIFGGFCCLLLQYKYAHRKLIAFYCSGVLYSIILDISSANYTVVCLLGGVISNISVFLTAHHLLREIQNYSEEKSSNTETDIPQKRGFLTKRTACAALAAVIIASPFSEICTLPFEKNILLFENLFGRDVYTTGDEDAYEMYSYDNGNTENKIDTKIDAGPMKGIYTSTQAAELYRLLLKDLDTMRSLTDRPVYIYALFSWMYLYLDRPYSTYSPWFVDSDFASRQILYWNLYPEKQPDLIYVPKLTCYSFSDMSIFSEILVERLHEYFDFEKTETETGYFLKLTDYHF